MSVAKSIFPLVQRGRVVARAETKEEISHSQDKCSHASPLLLKTAVVVDTFLASKVVVIVEGPMSLMRPDERAIV